MEKENLEEETEEDTEPEVTEEEETSEEKPEVVEEKKEEGGFKREMHKAICADCGKECEVPFQPTEGRSVYCRDCYRKHGPQTRRRF